VADEVRDALIDRVMTHIADKLDDDDKLIQLKSLYDENNSIDEIYAFLNTNIEDYDGFIDEVYSSFEKMYLDAMQDYEENADSPL
jgi:hypothetical protein